MKGTTAIIQRRKERPQRTSIQNLLRKVKRKGRTKRTCSTEAKKKSKKARAAEQDTCTMETAKNKPDNGQHTTDSTVCVDKKAKKEKKSKDTKNKDK